MTMIMFGNFHDVFLVPETAFKRQEGDMASKLWIVDSL